MDEETNPPKPPVDLPDDIASVLQDATVHDLREGLIYAQEPLQHNHEPTEQIEPLPGEEIVEIKGEGKRFTVLKRQPCADNCPDCPHGPYVYEVTQEKQLNGETHFHWAFIGPYIVNE